MKRWCAWLLIWLAGCSFESASSVETVDNRCSGDADCVEGLCDGRICIADAASSVEIAIEVLGSSSESQRLIPVSWAFTSERFSGPSVHDLVLPRVREVRGTVRWEGVRVPATLRFLRRMRSTVEPLQPVPVEIDTLREVSGGEGVDPFDFSTLLVAGETYEVAVVPTTDMVMAASDSSAPAIRSLPPLYLELEVDTLDASEPVRFDVSFPTGLDDPCTEIRTTACTFEAKVVSFDGEIELPEVGLQVRAIDKESGRVVSSIAETDEAGRFAIRLGEDASSYWIRVTPSAASDIFPAVSIDPEVAFGETPFDEVIRIPRLTPVQFTGRVRDETGTGVPGATVRFLSAGVFDENQLGLQGSYGGSTTTSEDGGFGTQLLPGVYSVMVTPPEDADKAWGVLTAEVVVGEELSVADALVLPRRAELFGWVRTVEGEAAVGVTVLARARPSAASAAMHRSQESVSNSFGRFTMQMDRGLYDMHVKIPAESGYPWLVEPGLEVESDLARTYLLGPPLPIEGMVLSSDGLPVYGALIRAYVLDEGSAPARHIQVAESVSDEEGNYRLLIAPEIGE